MVSLDFTPLSHTDAFSTSTPVCAVKQEFSSGGDLTRLQQLSVKATIMDPLHRRTNLTPQSLA